MSEETNTPEINEPTGNDAPTQPRQTIVEEIIYEDVEGGGRGCRGCVYGVVGALGCFVIFVVLFVGAIAVARPAVEEVFNGILNVVSGETVTSNITLPVVERIQNLQELKTVQYNFSNLVQGEVEMPPLLAGLYGENLVMIAVGHIEAGVDLGQLTQDDIALEGNTLTINLPAPQLLSCFLDEQQTRIVERNRGVFAPTNTELDNNTRLFALLQFVDLALEDGILLDAAEEGEQTIRQLIRFGIGADTDLALVINFAEPDASPPLPDTCSG